MAWPAVSRELVMTLVRYFSVSFGVYVFILLSMYVLVDCLFVDKTSSYLITYFLAYLAEYTMTLTVVFRGDHHWFKVLKFIANTAGFLCVGTLVFRALLYVQVNYLVATIGVALVLLPFRFLSNKYFVYR